MLLSGKSAQHEAHRDGYKPGRLGLGGQIVTLAENTLETREAVVSRAETLLAMEQNYEGIIGSDARNLIDLLMYQAGEETFSRYVDELCRLRVRNVGMKERLTFARNGEGGKDR